MPDNHDQLLRLEAERLLDANPDAASSLRAERLELETRRKVLERQIAASSGVRAATGVVQRDIDSRTSPELEKLRARRRTQDAKITDIERNAARIAGHLRTMTHKGFDPRVRPEPGTSAVHDALTAVTDILGELGRSPAGLEII